MKKLIHEEILRAKKALQEDLDEFGIVGNGFWEATERKIFDAIEKALTQKSQEWQGFKAPYDEIGTLLEEFKREKS